MCSSQQVGSCWGGGRGGGAQTAPLGSPSLQVVPRPRNVCWRGWCFGSRSYTLEFTSVLSSAQGTLAMPCLALVGPPPTERTAGFLSAGAYWGSAALGNSHPSSRRMERVPTIPEPRGSLSRPGWSGQGERQGYKHERQWLGLHEAALKAMLNGAGPGGSLAPELKHKDPWEHLVQWQLREVGSLPMATRQQRPGGRQPRDTRISQ